MPDVVDFAIVPRGGAVNIAITQLVNETFAVDDSDPPTSKNAETGAVSLDTGDDLFVAVLYDKSHVSSAPDVSWGAYPGQAQATNATSETPVTSDNAMAADVYRIRITGFGGSTGIVAHFGEADSTPSGVTIIAWKATGIPENADVMARFVELTTTDFTLSLLSRPEAADGIVIAVVGSAQDSEADPASFDGDMTQISRATTDFGDSRDRVLDVQYRLVDAREPWGFDFNQADSVQRLALVLFISAVDPSYEFNGQVVESIRPQAEIFDLTENPINFPLSLRRMNRDRRDELVEIVTAFMVEWGGGPPAEVP